MRPLALILLLFASAASAEPVVSRAPDSVSVTIYRQPDRGPAQPVNRRFPGGFALVTETRTVELPAGPAELRFEGVAGGILPESAIVRGLPGGLIEKNRDARLLSPGTLIDGHLGSRVHLTRTDRRTGAVTEEEAIVRANNDGVVIETAGGIEALGCSGLRDRVSYDTLPADLSAKPTLAVATTSPQATRATVTLSYLSSEFDWQANYVATLAPDGKTLSLSGWLTLVNATGESFADASLQAVAGKLVHRRTQPLPSLSKPLVISCWPAPELSREDAEDVGMLAEGLPAPPPPPPPPPPPAPMMLMAGLSRVLAVQEELADLKLYRMPVPVTVAAASTKQVGLLDADAVPVDTIYTATIDAAGGSPDTPQPLSRTLRTRNIKANHLGLPLPLGQLALFEPAGATRLLTAETSVRDLAVGEEWEIDAGASPLVRLAGRDDGKLTSLTVTNAGSSPARIEVKLVLAGGRRVVGVKLPRKDGVPLWTTTVPANGTATLRYRVSGRA